MNVLIACESSGIVAAAFRARGHSAYSCDLLPCDVPEWAHWHIQGDARAYLREQWDLLIAHLGKPNPERTEQTRTECRQMERA